MNDVKRNEIKNIKSNRNNNTQIFINIINKVNVNFNKS